MKKEFASVMDLVGKSVSKYSDWGDLDLNYKVVAKINNDVCINCNKCHIACEDTSHQCIDMLNGKWKPDAKSKGRRLCRL